MEKRFDQFPLVTTQLDGEMTTLLEMCQEEFKTRFETCRKEIQNRSLCQEGLNKLISEGARCSIINPLDVVKIDNEICPLESCQMILDPESFGIQMTLLGYCILYDNMKAMELLLDNGADILCSKEAGSPLFQALAHCHYQQIVKDAHLSFGHTPESLECCDSTSSHELKENHSLTITDLCCKMIDCFRTDRADIQKCKCFVHQLNHHIVRTFANIFVATKLSKCPSKVTHHDYKECQEELHLIFRKGNYPYNICYMAFCLDQRLHIITRSLLHFGADILEANNEGLPSYLQEYCDTGKPLYLSWLLNTLSQDKCDVLIEHIKARFMTDEWIENCKIHYMGRNISHSLLLNGAEQSIRKIIQKLKGCRNLLDETDINGRTALHIAAEMGETESVKVLIKMGADVTRRDIKGNTPLMSAARKKSKKNDLIAHFIIRHLLERLNGEHDQEEYTRQESFIIDQLEKLSEIESSPDETSFVQVAWNEAAESKNLKAIQAIAYKCKVRLPTDIISSAIRSGDLKTVELIDGIGIMYMPEYISILAFLDACRLGFSEIKHFYYQILYTERRHAALYYASESNNINALKFLISCEVDVNAITQKGYPLLIAAGQGHDECVALLLEAGADLSVKDHRGYNCLMIAAEKKHENVVKAILESGSNEYKRLFQVWTQTTEQDTCYITPLKLLIEHMPDMARLYLDSCDKQESGRYACIDDTFIMDGEKDEVKKLKHHKVIQNQENHVISCMIKHERQELLKQELVSQWIKHKWHRAQIIYYFTMVIYCIFLAVLTAFATVLPHPTDKMACTNSSNSDCLNSIGEHERMYFMYSAGVVLLILAALHLMIELLQLYYLQRSYLSDWENHLQIFVFIGTLVFVSAQYYAGVANCWCASKGMWQFGAVVVTCSWCNLIVILRSCPLYSIGSYTTLLFKICWCYVRVIYLHILLIATFAFSFYMLLIATMGADSSRAFSTPWWALASTFFGTAGFNSIFVETSIEYPAMGSILFSIFYVVVTMLFTNMLIGLSTSDAIEALKNAEFYSIACQVKFILFIKKAFPFIHYDSQDEREQQVNDEDMR